MRFVVVVALLLVACGSREPSTARPISALPAEAGPLDALSRRHARLRERMRGRGYGTAVGLTRTFVLEDRGVAFPLDLAVGKCSTFLALGGGSIRDMRLTLHDGDGQEAATDSIEGEGGLAHVCPQAAPAIRHRPYYLVVRAREGAGAVMLAQFRSEPGGGDGFEGIFDGVLAPRVPFRDVEAHLARSRSALRARGFSPSGQPLLDRVTEGAVVRLPVLLEAGRCYVATGRSGEGLADIDLFVFDGAGVEVARDLGADAEPSIEHCPPESGRHTVELRAYEGAGAVGVMIFEGPAPGSEAAPVESAPPEPSSDPSLALGVLVAPLATRGFAPPIHISRDAAIVPGEVRTHEVVVGPGCGLIAGSASHEGLDLDLYLADADGREVDRDTAVHSTARVRACRDVATVLRVAVKGYGRDGTYALAVLRAPEDIRTLVALRLEEASAPFLGRGYVTRSTAEAELSTGARLRRPLVVEAGQCVAIAAAGGEGVEDLDLYLRFGDELVASESGAGAHAAVARCATAREVLSMDLAMTRGAGDVVLRVLAPPPPIPASGSPAPEASPAPASASPAARPAEAVESHEDEPSVDEEESADEALEDPAPAPAAE